VKKEARFIGRKTKVAEEGRERDIFFGKKLPFEGNGKGVEGGGETRSR